MYLRNLIVWLLGLFGLASLVFAASGCGEKLTVQEKIQVWKEATTFLKENRIAGQATLSSRGDGSVYAKQSFGLDTGLNLNVAAQFNATEGQAVDDQQAPNQ